MEQIHDRVAGLDVHRDQVTACVRIPGPRGGVRTEKGRFGTTTGGLAALAEWLSGHAVTLAAMEATGVYWKPVCATRRWCAVRRWEPKEVEDLLAGPSQRPGRSGAQSDPGDAGEGGKQR